MIIVHAAGITSIEECHENPKKTMNTNIIGSYNVIKVCNSKKVYRLIFTSSLYVQSNKGSFYRISKQAVESMIEVFKEKHNLPFTIVRYGSLFGQNSQNWNFIKKLILNLNKKNQININYKKKLTRNYIHVNDAAELTVNCIARKYLNKCVLITGKKKILISNIIKYVKKLYSKNKIKVNYSTNNTDHYSNNPKLFKYKTHQIMYPKKSKSLFDEIKNIYKDVNKK